MKNFSLLLVTMLSIVTVAPNAMAADSEVKWSNPDKYRDIYPGEESRKKFRAKTFAKFEQHFAKLAAKLPEGQTLKVDVTNVDLAGDVHHGSIDQIRIVKDIHFPKLSFSYQLVDKNNQVIKESDVKLKDMNFLQNRSLKYRNDFLGYEKKMLDKWFKESFMEETVAKAH